jgi:hypothetical protein
LDGVLFVPSSPVFGILKNYYQTTLLDTYLEAIELRKNINELRVEWQKEGIAAFKQKMGNYRFAKDVIFLVEQLSSYKKIFEE